MKDPSPLFEGKQALSLSRMSRTRNVDQDRVVVLFGP